MLAKDVVVLGDVNALVSGVLIVGAADVGGSTTFGEGERDIELVFQPLDGRLSRERE